MAKNGRKRKLSAEQEKEVRELRSKRPQEWTIEALADRYKVGVATISQILQRK